MAFLHNTLTHLSSFCYLWQNSTEQSWQFSRSQTKILRTIQIICGVRTSRTIVFGCMHERDQSVWIRRLRHFSTRERGQLPICQTTLYHICVISLNHISCQKQIDKQWHWLEDQSVWIGISASQLSIGKIIFFNCSNHICQAKLARNK